MPQRNLIAILLVALVAMACYRATDHNPSVRMFQRALGEITQNYVEEVDPKKLVEAAIRGVVGELHDPNSEFQSPESSQAMQTDLHQQFSGIGVEVNLDQQSQQLTVVNPVVGTPAFDAGLLSGDRILEIDGQNTKGFKIVDAVKLIRGSAGVPVALKIERAGTEKPLSFNIPRAVIRTDSVLGDTRLKARQWNFMLEDHPGIAYIRVQTFGDRTLEELKAALASLEKQGIKGLVLDLRDNPGGLLDAGVAVCNLFIREGTLVSVHGREGTTPRIYTADGTAPYTNFPMVVLIDRQSASASEIVAACLQDRGRAAVAGERSYGKGTVQNVIGLEGGHTLKLTTAHWYPPSGKNIHRQDAKGEDDWGVHPDKGLDVKLSREDLINLLLARHNRDFQRPGAPTPPADEDSPDEKPFTDEALQKAIEHLQQALDAKKPAAPANNAA